MCYQINAEKTIPLDGSKLGAVSFFTFIDPRDSLKMSLVYGFEVFVTDQGSFPNRFDKSDIISPGYIHTVKASVTKITAIKERLENKVCYDNDNPGKYYVRPFYGAPELSVNSCPASNAIVYMNSTFGCIDIPNKHSDDMENCTVHQLESMMDYSSGIPITLKEKEFIDRNFKNASPTGCIPPCKLKTYDYNIHSNRIEPQVYRVLSLKLNTTVEKIKERGLIVIRVIFPDTLTDVVEIRRYTLGNLLGDVGGVFGLFLGFSVFTFLEYLYFAVFYLLKRLSCNRIKGHWLVDSMVEPL